MKSEKASDRQESIVSSRTPASPTISTIPYELHLDIVEHLDEVDKVCLSLCNRILRFRIRSDCGPICIKKASSCHQRFQFLFRLSRDFSGCFPCYNCSTIHFHTLSIRLPPSMCKQRQFGPRMLAKPLVDALGCRPSASSTFAYYRGMLDYFETYKVYANYLFTFQHVQLAMAKYHNETNFGISLEALSWTEVRRSFKHKYSTLLSIDAGVVQRQLCLRVQHWIALDVLSSGTYRAFSGSVHDAILPPVCLHHGVEYTPRFLRYLMCKVTHTNEAEPPDCDRCRDNLHCERCGVEFNMDIQRLLGAGNVFVMTKWLNFGHGETPLDPKWQRHLTRGTTPDLPKFPNWRSAVPLSKSFDNGKTQETLEQENAATLCYGLYRHTFKRQRAIMPLSDESSNKKIWVHPEYTANCKKQKISLESNQRADGGRYLDRGLSKLRKLLHIGESEVTKKPEYDEQE